MKQLIQKNIQVLIVVLLFFSGYSKALVIVPDTTENRFGIEEEQVDFTDDLDSLLQSWYIQNYESNAIDSFTLEGFQTVELNDSIIKWQLSQIASPFSLDYNEQVKAFINLYLNKRTQQLSYMLGLSEYYFPIFEEIFDKYDIPLELKYLAIIESALNPRAVSRVGATGLWQFMYSTGKIYKLEINSYVDDRRDPIKSTEAAAQFLSQLYKIYKDWTLVIAAYNCGPGNVNKAIRRSGGKTNYWEIYYRLPRETRGYVPAFIAATYAFHYHKEYNIKPVAMELPIMTDTMQISQNLHFGQVSDLLNVPVEELRELNPQYKKDIVPGRENNTYALVIPQEFAMNFVDLEDTLYRHKDTIYFAEKEVIAPQKYEPTGVNPPSSKNTTPLTYTIQSGDNLGFISSWYNVSVNDLKYWNNINRNNIRAGKTLTIYVPKEKASYYAKVNDLSFEEKQARVGKSASVSNNSSVDTAPKTTFDKNAKYVYYTVKKGDNFWSIAQKYPGVSNTDIMELNGITNPTSLKPGQVLKIKKKS
ncbi:MAG: transglycosylase SLT domain-containing protein [Bacteroidales bacterium]|nr:transglycosylase SLT domain-containing protein [Bacteroidales bacterium]